MLALVYWPLLYLLAGAGILWWLMLPAGATTVLGLAWVYLLPPLLCRATLLVFGRPATTEATPADRLYKVWWFLTQLQMPFNRISLLEEALRLIPGAYALWLNLWGAHVSPFAFFSREVFIADRYLVRIGRGAVFAAYTGITPHLVDRGPDGRLRLILAPVEVGPNAIVGIGAGLGPGCRVGPGETLPAGRRLPPFTAWEAGRKRPLPSTSG